MQLGAEKIPADAIVEPLFLARRREVLRDRDALGVADVLGYLPPQCLLADRSEPPLQLVEVTRIQRPLHVTSAECRQAAEDVLIEEADEAIQFEQRVLKRRRREKHLGVALHRVFYCAGDLVPGFVDVAKSVRFVDDDQVPVDRTDSRTASPSELVGTDHSRSIVLERVRRAGLLPSGPGARVENDRRDEELLAKLLRPLLPQRRGDDDENPARPFRP